jgi:cytochrome c oxidase assembly factor 6
MVYGLDWLTGSPKPEVKPVREKSKDGGYVAPDRSARDLCYESRDLFYACLDKHDILDANKDDELARQKCPTENAEFERDCAKSWVCSNNDGVGWEADESVRRSSISRRKG